MGFQRLRHVIWGTDILFEKLTPEIGGGIGKTCKIMRSRPSFFK